MTAPQDKGWEEQMTDFIPGKFIWILPDEVTKVDGKVVRMGDTVKFYEGKPLSVKFIRNIVETQSRLARKEERERILGMLPKERRFVPDDAVLTDPFHVEGYNACLREIRSMLTEEK